MKVSIQLRLFFSPTERGLSSHTHTTHQKHTVLYGALGKCFPLLWKPCRSFGHWGFFEFFFPPEPVENCGSSPLTRVYSRSWDWSCTVAFLLHRQVLAVKKYDSIWLFFLVWLWFCWRATMASCWVNSRDLRQAAGGAARLASSLPQQ